MLSDKTKKYFLSRSVPIELVISANIKDVSQNEGAALLGLSSLSSEGIAFLYPNVHPPYYRIRLDAPGEGTRYLVPPSCEVPIYFHPNQDVNEGMKPIVVVESPTKALALMNLGYIAIGLGGVCTTLQKGIHKLNDSWKKVNLYQREVVLLLDSNRTSNINVAEAEARLASALQEAGAEVRIASLPKGTKGEDIGPDDFITQYGGERIHQIVQYARPACPRKIAKTYLHEDNFIALLEDMPFLVSLRRSSEAVKRSVEKEFQKNGIGPQALKRAIRSMREKYVPSGFKSTTLPKIYLSNQQSEVIADAWNALLCSSESERIFKFGNRLAQLIKTNDGEELAIINSDEMFSYLIRCAHWYRRSDSVGKVPSYVVSDMLNRHHPSLRNIEGVKNLPALGRNFELINKPGYDPSTHLYFDIPETLSVAKASIHLNDAIKFLLEDVLGDFPFADISSEANCLALLLLPCLRPCIIGPTPLHLIDGSRPGSGKTLIAKIVSCIGSGIRSVMLAPFPENESEIRKAITAALAKSPDFLIYDNVNRKIDSGALSAALTARTWSDRILGTSDAIELPIRTIWLATGNNLDVSEEIARRAILIRLVPEEEDPHKRDKFLHDNLESWVLENRYRIIKALMALISFWKSQGCPRGSVRLGSFEEWSGMLSGILETCGIRGFLENSSQLFDVNNDENAEWKSFVLEWFERFGGRSIDTGSLFELAERERLFLSLTKKENGRISFGMAISKRRDQILGGFQIIYSGRGKGGKSLYQLKKATSGERVRLNSSLSGNKKNIQNYKNNREDLTLTPSSLTLSGEGIDIQGFSAVRPEGETYESK